MTYSHNILKDNKTSSHNILKDNMTSSHYILKDNMTSSHNILKDNMTSSHNILKAYITVHLTSSCSTWTAYIYFHPLGSNNWYPITFILFLKATEFQQYYGVHLFSSFYSITLFPLKGACHAIFEHYFLMILTHLVLRRKKKKYFQFRFRFCRDIRS